MTVTSEIYEVHGATAHVYKRRWSDGMRWSEYNQAPRMYVKIDDETILENLENRKRRPYNVYKTLIHSSGLNTIFTLDGMRWSQRAGCTMCPCSPGFILPRQLMHIGDIVTHYYDVWVTLEGAPMVDERKAPRAIAVA